MEVRGWTAGLVPKLYVGASYAVLGFLWLELAALFARLMWSRLNAVLQGAPIANTPPCNAPYCDFSIFWPAGLLARRGDLAGIYDPVAFLAWRRLVLFQGAQALDWIYAPPSLLPFMLLSHLPIGLAYFVWTIALALGAIYVLRWAGLSWKVIAISMVCPAALQTMEVGQSDIFCGTAVIAGLLMADRAKLRAGALLGLLIFKPQVGLLAPLVVVFHRNWRAVFAGLAVVLISAMLVTALLGWNIWPVYEQFSPMISRSYVTAARPVGEDAGVSVLWMLRSAGVGIQPSFSVQAAVTVSATGLLLLTWRVTAFSRETKIALTACLSLLATPYGHIDDMMAFSIAIAMLAERNGWRINPLDALFWLWPVLSAVFFHDTGVILTPVVVVTAAALTWARAARLPQVSPVLPRAGED